MRAPRLALLMIICVCMTILSLWQSCTSLDSSSIQAEIKLAMQGHADAQYNLGVIYANGLGVSQDYKEAIKWFKMAAEQGYTSAQNNLGVIYENGRGVPKDYTEAMKWYTKAAEQDDAYAQNNLGRMYKNGQGVPTDYIEAMKWFRKAAEQGHDAAKKNMAILLMDDRGNLLNYSNVGTQQLKLAAEQGFFSAQYLLGIMYCKGRGVPQDYIQAHKWLSLSVSAPLLQAFPSAFHEEVKKQLETITEQMTPGQIAAAQLLATDWMEKHNR